MSNKLSAQHHETLQRRLEWLGTRLSESNSSKALFHVQAEIDALTAVLEIVDVEETDEAVQVSRQWYPEPGQVMLLRRGRAVPQEPTE